MSQDLFVYGTLLFPEVVKGLCGRHFHSLPARLPGYAALQTVRGFPIPALVPRRGAVTPGRLLQAVDSRSLRLFDEFEEIGAHLYRKQRVQVTLAGGQRRRALVYLGGPRMLPLLGETVWQADNFRAYLADYLRRVVHVAGRC